MPIFRLEASQVPWGGLRWLQREVDQLMGASRLFGNSRRVGGGNYPPVNVCNGDAEIIVMAEVPGVASEDLDLSITGETLVIKGVRKPTVERNDVTFQRRERESGQFGRTVILPDKVDAENVTARLADGVLTITLPKSEAAKPKQIAVHS